MSETPDETPIPHCRVDEDGILHVLLESGDGKAPFTLGPETIERLERIISRFGGDQGIRGLLVYNHHEKVFCAGADLDAMAGLASPTESDRLVRRGQVLFTRLAHLPFPTAALIHGTCLGGGYELALACRARTASDDDATRIGLPEVQLGIIPAWGGSTRLARLAGLARAIPLVTAGKALDARRALRQGLVDSVVPREYVLREGLRLLDALRQGQSVRSRRTGLKAFLLEGNPLGRALLERVASKRILGQTKGHYPAPEAALRVMVRGRSRPTAEALDMEREEVVRLLATPVHANLLRLFQITRESARPQVYSTGRAAPLPVETGVVGSGVMGAGIAALLATRGFSVRLMDPFPEALSRGWARIQAEVGKLVSRRRLQAFEARRILGRVSISTAVDGLAALDVVIEAVPERRDLKLDVLRALSAGVRPDALIGTNTSSFPLEELGEAIADPTRFLGLHFFNPPTKMPLLEIVRGSSTSDAAVARGLRFASALGKTPIVVGDGPGFLVNRLLAPYFQDACRLAQEGVPVATIDGALTGFGMPMGPFRLMDEVGLDIVKDASDHMSARAGFTISVHPFIVELVEQQHLGCKSGQGFYRYGKGRPQESPAFERVRRRALRPGGEPASTGKDIADRLVGRMIAEARKVLGEGIVLAPEDVDIGTVFGIGFPAFRGGLLRYAATREDRARDGSGGDR